MEEAREHEGRQVTYRTGTDEEATGELVFVNSRYAFVNYGDERAIATHPSDLTLAEATP